MPRGLRCFSAAGFSSRHAASFYLWPTPWFLASPFVWSSPSRARGHGGGGERISGGVISRCSTRVSKVQFGVSPNRERVRKSQDERFSIVTAIKVSDETSETTRETRVLQLIFALGVEELMGAVVIGFGHKNFGRAIQVAVVGRGGIDEFLRGDDAVFLEHDTSISVFTTGPV